MLKRILRKEKVVDPIFHEGELAFSNSSTVSENPYSFSNAEHAKAWESGYYSAKKKS